MITEGIYDCKIFLKTHEIIENDGLIHCYGRYVKDAIVQASGISSSFIDIQTGERYYIGATNKFVKVGNLYIQKDYGLVPFNKLIGNTRENMTKRKVLKKYKEYKSQEKDKE